MSTDNDTAAGQVLGGGHRAPGPGARATPAAEDRLVTRRVVARRNLDRRLAVVVVLVLVAQFVNGLVTNPFYEWGKFAYWFHRPVILDGLLVTLKVTALSAVLGLAGGVVLALGRLSRNPLLQVTSWAMRSWASGSRSARSSPPSARRTC
jgi:polar amino acid transport system permease protein